MILLDLLMRDYALNTERVIAIVAIGNVEVFMKVAIVGEMITFMEKIFEELEFVFVVNAHV